MSERFPGGLITKTPVTPSGPYETSTASGIWTLDQQAAYAKQGIWPTAGRFVPDPQFNYVTMLLHGDGTNGAQNNTFLDSSTNNFTITRNGNTTQGSFSPYGSNWSANLPATVISGLQFDRLGTTSSFNFMHNASALWTLEVWVNLSVLPTSLFPIFSNNDVSSSSIGVTTYINSSGQVVLFITNGTAGLKAAFLSFCWGRWSWPR